VPSSVRRAAAFAAVGTLALAAPSAGALTAVPFALIAVVGRLVSEGPLFALFASPADEVAGQLRSLVSFSLAVTGLALLASLTGLSAAAFVVGRAVCAERGYVNRSPLVFGPELGSFAGNSVPQVGEDRSCPFDWWNGNRGHSSSPSLSDIIILGNGYHRLSGEYFRTENGLYWRVRTDGSHSRPDHSFAASHSSGLRMLPHWLHSMRPIVSMAVSSEPQLAQ
jgi:hypothetical protein